MSDATRREPVGERGDLSAHEQLSRLKALVALSMRMTDNEDEDEIIRLAGAVVSSASSFQYFGAYRLDDGWLPPVEDSAALRVRSDVETQLAVVGPAGGAVAIDHATWGWAFPLRSLDGNLGFLAVCADNTPVAGEEFLMRVLAQQTGVALANARVGARQRRQAAELIAANEQLARTVAALERNTAIHDLLTSVATSGAGPQGIAEAVHQLTNLPVAVEDRHGNLRAWAGPKSALLSPKESPERREAVIAEAVAAGAPIRHGGRLLVVACPRDDIVGVLALIDPDEAAGEQARVALEHGATVLSTELIRLSAIAETELHLRRDLVDDLLTGTDEESAIARAEALGYDLERAHRAIVVETCGSGTDGPQPATLFHAVRRAARDCGVGSLVAGQGRSVVVLADTDRPWEIFRSTVERELNGLPCRVGVGSSCESIGCLPRSLREAVQALRVQRFAGGDRRATVFDELGVYRLFASLQDLDAVDRFVRIWLGDLIDYDASRGASELVVTLGEFLDRGGSYDGTARALSIHRSTLKYRLQRIREISGHDLAVPETQFNLALAVRAQRTLQAVRGDP